MKIGTSLAVLFLGISVLSSCGIRTEDTIGEVQILSIDKELTTAEIPVDILDSLQSGDLIVRHGIGFSSDMFKKANQRDDTYSHGGIISRDSNNVLFVYHMLGGNDNPHYNLKRDSLSNFYNSDNALSFALFKYNMSKDVRKRTDSICYSYYLADLTFDMEFDLETDEKMYCSEFVYKTLSVATYDSNFIPLSAKDGKSIVGIDDLYLNNNTQKLFEHEYL